MFEPHVNLIFYLINVVGQGTIPHYESHIRRVIHNNEKLLVLVAISQSENYHRGNDDYAWKSLIIAD